MDEILQERHVADLLPPDDVFDQDGVVHPLQIIDNGLRIVQAEGPQAGKPAVIDVTTNDLLEYFDFKLEYLDVTNGAKLTENIVAYTEFKKEFGNVSLPLNMGYNVTATLKAGKTIDDVKAVEKMDYIAPFPTAWITMYKKDNTIWGQGGHSYNTSGATSLSGAKVAERYEKGSFNTSYYQSIDEKGSGTEGSWK